MRIIFTNLAEIKGNINKFADKLPEVAEQIVDANFIKMTGYAQDNAPWTDRTGDARRSIDYRNLSTKEKLAFYLYIGVTYGIYLELSNGGKYRILQPTFTIHENELIKDLGNIGINARRVV
jgi:hypothetical protein